MITAMDSAIGDLVETLKESGEYENTLIVFTADVSKVQSTLCGVNSLY